MNNFFDIEKWQNKVNPSKDGEKSPTKELKRVNTLATMMLNTDGEAPAEKDRYLLSKTYSTAHIPENSRSKNTRRIYANFDKDLAAKMFGYRVIFKKRAMEVPPSDPATAQTHKPVKKYVEDILSELASNYQPMHRYHTKQRILVPLPDSEDEEFIDE